MAQLVTRLPEDLKVPGSIPGGGNKLTTFSRIIVHWNYVKKSVHNYTAVVWTFHPLRVCGQHGRVWLRR